MRWRAVADRAEESGAPALRSAAAARSSERRPDLRTRQASMSSIPLERAARRSPRGTANDRLKSLWGARLSASILAAALLHAAVLVLWPAAEPRSQSVSRGETPRVVALRVPGAHEVGRGPVEIAAPELPTVEELHLDLPLDAAGPLPTFSDPALEEPIVPALLSVRDEWLDYESFAPILIAPFIRNRTEMRSFLERNYRPILEFSGVQGVVELHFWIDESGGVFRAEVAESSGSRSLDRLAMRLSRILRFSPAMRLGRPVRVLVRLPISFRHT